MSKNAAPEFIISKEFGKYESPKPCKDLVVVVRCKDCKFYPDGNGTTKWLPCKNIIVPPRWFCADGKRNDE